MGGKEKFPRIPRFPQFPRNRRGRELGSEIVWHLSDQWGFLQKTQSGLDFCQANKLAADSGSSEENTLTNSLLFDSGSAFFKGILTQK